MSEISLGRYFRPVVRTHSGSHDCLRMRAVCTSELGITSGGIHQVSGAEESYLGVRPGPRSKHSGEIVEG